MLFYLQSTPGAKKADPQVRILEYGNTLFPNLRMDQKLNLTFTVKNSAFFQKIWTQEIFLKSPFAYKQLVEFTIIVLIFLELYNDFLNEDNT